MTRVLYRTAAVLILLFDLAAAWRSRNEAPV